MRNPQVSCAWCGHLIDRNAPRMRLHETPDSSLRSTQMVASFHPACGRALVEHIEDRRQMTELLASPRPAWARNPRHQ